MYTRNAPYGCQICSMSFLAAGYLTHWSAKSEWIHYSCTVMLGIRLLEVNCLAIMVLSMHSIVKLGND